MIGFTFVEAVPYDVCVCSQIFDEVEKRRQISMAMIYPFMQKLREAPFPAPGNTVEIKSFIPESGTEVRPNPPPIPLFAQRGLLSV